MKYLACAFRNNVLLYSARVTSEQIMYFKENVCSMFNVALESLTLVKYDLAAVQSFERNEGFVTKVGIDKVSLVKFINEPQEFAEVVDMMTASMSELEEFYSEEEVIFIIENREALELGEELPHKVARKIKTVIKTVTQETVIATLQPES
jgi:hypothetical protein